MDEGEMRCQVAGYGRLWQVTSGYPKPNFFGAGARDENQLCRDFGMKHTVFQWRLSHGQTAWEPAGGGEGGVVRYEGSCDWRFQPPKPLLKILKQEGLQLEAFKTATQWSLGRDGSGFM